MLESQEGLKHVKLHVAEQYKHAEDLESQEGLKPMFVVT